MRMLTERIELSYDLAFDSPFHFGTGLRAGLVHRTVRRDADGYLFVPGATIKGVLRERCEQIARLFGLRAASPHDGRAGLAEFRPNADLVRSLFGSRTQPGALFFDDAAMSAAWREFFDHPSPALRAKYRAWQVDTRTQVSLSRLTRTARPGLLFTSEYGPAGAQFEGRVYGSISGLALEDGSTTFGLVLLLAGMLAIERLGGNRSAGLGRCRLQITSLRRNGMDEEVATWVERLGELELHDLFAEEP